MNIKEQIEQLEEIVTEYSKPNSDVDSGNLFYALAQALVIIKKQADKIRKINKLLEEND